MRRDSRRRRMRRAVRRVHDLIPRPSTESAAIGVILSAPDAVLAAAVRALPRRELAALAALLLAVRGRC